MSWPSCTSAHNFKSSVAQFVLVSHSVLACMQHLLTNWSVRVLGAGDYLHAHAFGQGCQAVSALLQEGGHNHIGSHAKGVPGLA